MDFACCILMLCHCRGHNAGFKTGILQEWKFLFLSQISLYVSMVQCGMTMEMCNACICNAVHFHVNASESFARYECLLVT